MGTPGSLLAISKPIYALLEELKEENKNNLDIQKLMAIYADKDGGAVGFLVRNGVLFFKDRYYLYAHSPLIKKILYEFHDSQLGGHSGVHKTWKRVEKYFFWPNMGVDIRKYVRECIICQQVKPVNSKVAGMLMPLPIPSNVW